jgi:uncharacterized protein YbjT (DUF2867 family)
VGMLPSGTEAPVAFTQPDLGFPADGPAAFRWCCAPRLRVSIDCSNSFMQNVVTYMGGTIKAEAAFYSASGAAKISHVDVRDIAAIAVKAPTEPNHEGKAYTLTGPEALTYDDLASELSKVLGRSISHISLSPSDLKRGMLAEGLPEEVAERMLDLERYFREDQASSITNDIRQVTGRDPRRFAQYARDCASSLQPGE